MKVVLNVLMFIALLSSINCAAQKKIVNHSYMPVKGANLIVIESGLSDIDLYKIAGEVLLKEGYGIESSDQNIFHIKSKDEARNNFGFTTSIDIVIVDQKIFIRGDAKHKKKTFIAFSGNNTEKYPVKSFRLMEQYARRLKFNIENSLIIFYEEEIVTI